MASDIPPSVARPADPPRAGRFEALLAAEHEQFDRRGALLKSITEYMDAPSGTTSATQYSGDLLRTLDRERAVIAAMQRRVARNPLREILWRRPWRSPVRPPRPGCGLWGWLRNAHDCADPSVGCSCNGGYRFPTPCDCPWCDPNPRRAA